MSAENGGPLQALLSTLKDVWQIIFVPLGLGGWAVYRDLTAQRAKTAGEKKAMAQQHETDEAAGMRAERESLRERDAAVYVRFAEQFKRQQEEIKALAERIEELTREVQNMHVQLRTKGDARDKNARMVWQRYQQARDLMHAAANARFIAEGLAKKLGVALDPWQPPALDLPPFEEPPA